MGYRSGSPGREFRGEGWESGPNNSKWRKTLWQYHGSFVTIVMSRLGLWTDLSLRSGDPHVTSPRVTSRGDL